MVKDKLGLPLAF